MPEVEAPKKTIADLNKEDRDTIHTAEVAKSFLESKFGKFYFATLDTHIEGKINELAVPLEPNSGFDGIGYALRAESSKGAIMGLRLAKQLLVGMVEAGRQVRKLRGIDQTGGEDE